ncbi:MAG: hypothetical protein KKB37_12470 [Alphaproteobacteria bacterium]|nr:hypothetical protein [Alphaproteobacteria bacterium]
MKSLMTTLLAVLTLLAAAANAHAQSGQYTEQACIENLMKPQDKKPAQNTDDPRREMTGLKVPSVDLNDDGVISREEARKACSGADKPG